MTGKESDVPKDETGKIAAAGDLVSVRTVDKPYKDEAGNQIHEDFIKVELILPFKRETFAELGELVTEHEQVAFTFAPMQGKLAFMDALVEKKTQAQRERAREAAIN